MDKVFELTWLGGKKERIRGSNISNACAKAGIFGGAINVLDSYKEITELPLNEKILCHIDKDGSLDEIQNTTFIEQIRAVENIEVGDTVCIKFANKMWGLTADVIDGISIQFSKEVKPITAQA